MFAGAFQEPPSPTVDEVFGVGVVAFGGAADIGNLGGVVAEGVLAGVGLDLDAALGQGIMFGAEF